MSYLKDILNAHHEEYYRTGNIIVKSFGWRMCHRSNHLKFSIVRAKRIRKIYGRTLRVITRLKAIEHRRVTGGGW
jgi:hypothetical protein